MKHPKSSRNWLSLALVLGLSASAFTASAHEASATSSTSGSATNQSDGKTAPGIQHHFHRENGYQGHHGSGAYPNHHGMHGQGGMMHHDMNSYGGMGPGPKMELGLDDDQLEEIAEIQKKLRSEVRELKVERYEASLKLQELYAAEDLDAGDINDQQQKVFDVIKEITELQVEAQRDIRDLLNSEQKRQLLRSGNWLMLN